MRTQEQIQEYLRQFKAKKLQEREKEKLKKTKEQAKKPKKVKMSPEEAKEKMRAYQKAYREAHKTKMKEQQREWYQAHKEEQIEKHREYWNKNREYLNAQAREKYRENHLLIYSERDIEKFYTRDLFETREELMEAEETENARIDWTAWDKLVKDTREKLLS